MGGGAGYVCTDCHCEANKEARIFFRRKRKFLGADFRVLFGPTPVGVQNGSIDIFRKVLKIFLQSISIFDMVGGTERSYYSQCFFGHMLKSPI